MASYKIILQSQADKTYQWLFRRDRPLHARIRSSLLVLQMDPHAGKPLRGPWQGTWSFRVGMYRILYRIERNILTVVVLDIGHRREIYR